MKKYFILLVVLLAGTLLIQGFQCASSEMTTAKVAAKNQDFQKAITYLKKELQNNPENEEAWVLLAEVHENLGNYDEMAEALNKAEKVVKTQEFKDRVPRLKNVLWVNAYNKGISYFNQYFEDKNKKYLDSAIMKYDLAISVRPERPDFYKLKAMAYEQRGDTSKAINAYQKYMSLMEEEIQLAKQYNITINMSRDEALSTLGEPEDTFGTKTGQEAEADSLITDLITVDNKPLYLYSRMKPDEQPKVVGWYYDPPENVPEFEKKQQQNIDIGPMAALAQIYYDNKEYDKALKYVNKIRIVDPTNSQANSFLVQIYHVQGKSDEALKAVRDMAQNNPNNKLYRAQYGDLLLNMKKWDKAIEQYEKALEIDPDYAYAMVFLASALKNKAKDIQNEQIDKLDEDPKYEADPQEYFPLLERAAQYFEKSLDYEQYSNDIDILGELINVYEVLDRKNKVATYLAELESLEFLVEERNKEKYYRTMCSVYTKLQKKEKRKEYCDKYKEMTK